MPQNVPFPVAPAYPANLTALTDGDSNNGANHLAVMEDVAQAVQYLKDSADVADALLTTANTWTMFQTFDGGFEVDNASSAIIRSGSTLQTIAGSATVIQGTASFSNTVLFGGDDAVVQQRTSQISSASTAVTISVTKDIWYVDVPSFVGTAVYTLKSTSPAPPAGSTVKLRIYGLAAGKDIDVQREGGAQVINFDGAGTGFGEAEFHFLGSSWRLGGFSGDNTIVLGTP